MLFYLPYILLPYCILLIVLYIYWSEIPVLSNAQSISPPFVVSILIAVRNEERGIENLLVDIDKQEYSTSHLEVLVLDDHSVDRTAAIVEAYQSKASYSLQLIKLSDTITGKKAALTEGVGHAKGSLIITTDGDCRVKPTWVSTIASFYQSQKLKMVTGGVSFFDEKTLRSDLLVLEFAGLVGSGAATLKMGLPSMCNGANLAFEKQAFIEVNGYEGTENIASGDDEFLMHKIAKQYPGKVTFLKNKEAWVETGAPTSWKAFFEQRRRWSSKWGNYTFFHIKLLAILIFSFNLGLLVNLSLSFLESYPLKPFLILLSIKFVLEFLFLRTVLVSFGRKIGIWGFLIAQIVYPFYVVLFAFAGRTSKYRWKGRIVK